MKKLLILIITLCLLSSASAESFPVDISGAESADQVLSILEPVLGKSSNFMPGMYSFSPEDLLLYGIPVDHAYMADRKIGLYYTIFLKGKRESIDVVLASLENQYGPPVYADQQTESDPETYTFLWDHAEFMAHAYQNGDCSIDLSFFQLNREERENRRKE